ncbi:hypothetical protein Tco_0115239 [Tanacetum coccineum]
METTKERDSRKIGKKFVVRRTRSKRRQEGSGQNEMIMANDLVLGDRERKEIASRGIRDDRGRNSVKVGWRGDRHTRGPPESRERGDVNGVGAVQIEKSRML